MKRKHENNEDEFQERKRRMTDEKLRELVIDFALNIVNKLESENKEHLNQIVRLAVDKNEALINIWRTLVISKDESAKIRKFISLMNIRFDMVNISNIY